MVYYKVKPLLRDENQMPKKVFYSKMVYDYKHTMLYVFGGTNYKNSFGQLYCFDMKTGEWSKPSTFNQE